MRHAIRLQRELLRQPVRRCYAIWSIAVLVAMTAVLLVLEWVRRDWIMPTLLILLASPLVLYAFSLIALERRLRRLKQLGPGAERPPDNTDAADRRD